MEEEPVTQATTIKDLSHLKEMMATSLNFRLHSKELMDLNQNKPIMIQLNSVIAMIFSRVISTWIYKIKNQSYCY